LRLPLSFRDALSTFFPRHSRIRNRGHASRAALAKPAPGRPPRATCPLCARHNTASRHARVARLSRHPRLSHQHPLPKSSHISSALSRRSSLFSCFVRSFLACSALMRDAGVSFLAASFSCKLTTLRGSKAGASRSSNFCGGVSAADTGLPSAKSVVPVSARAVRRPHTSACAVASTCSDARAVVSMQVAPAR